MRSSLPTYNLLNVVIDSVDRYRRVKRCLYTCTVLENFQPCVCFGNPSPFVFLKRVISLLIDTQNFFFYKLVHFSKFHAFTAVYSTVSTRNDFYTSTVDKFLKVSSIFKTPIICCDFFSCAK